MSTDRLPRKFLTSWIPLPRGVGRPVSDYTDTILKALESVGIGEDVWFHLAKDEFWWRNFIATTDEERKELLSAFRRGMNIAGPSDAAGNFDLTTSIEMPDTPLSRRRMEHLIAGGLVRKLKRNQFDDPTPVIDLRHIDERNCFELPKQRVKSSSPESLSAQLKMDCGYDERRRSTTAVRLSQCGIFYYRAE